MSVKEKLQKAIEATIAAGYQLNSEAFEFLSQISETNDPVSIMDLALEKLQGLVEKPMFIEKGFLESLLEQPTVFIPKIQPQQQQNSPEMPIKQQTSTAESTFYPYAKEIQANINILEDATGKLSSN